MRLEVDGDVAHGSAEPMAEPLSVTTAGELGRRDASVVRDGTIAAQTFAGRGFAEALAGGPHLRSRVRACPQRSLGSGGAAASERGDAHR